MVQAAARNTPERKTSAAKLEAFAPDGGRAAYLSERMKGEFVRSMRDLLDACRGKAEFDAQRVTAGLDVFGNLRNPSAATYTAYFDLLQAVQQEDWASCESLLAEFANPQFAPARMTYRRWGGIDEVTAERYLRYVKIDPTTEIDFMELSEREFADTCERADQAFAIFDKAAPEISAEIRCLINDLVFVGNNPDSALEFHGATSVFSWGALFLNAPKHETVVDMIDGLSHESAHAHLFGLSLGDAFVTNPPDELHPSPLRDDPRPLDGTFHATFVSARMHYAHDKVLASELLDAENRGRAIRARAEAVRAFQDGLAVIDAHANLTPLGEAVMAETRAYMARANA